MTTMTPAQAWSSALELDSARRRTAGSEADLAAAIARGADLRIYTEFRHHEHVDVESDRNELIQEVSQFGVTCLIERRWSAGFMTLRQPVSLPGSFGPLPSLSLFLYNQDGSQAIARPMLDRSRPMPTDSFSFPGMAKMHCDSVIDRHSMAPAMNFVYDFDTFRFCVLDRWSMVLSHDAQGRVADGDITALAEAFATGAHVKVGVSGLYDELSPPGVAALPHEVFVECHSCYHYTKERLFIAASQPLPRCRVGTPMRYEPGGWDYGWLLLRTDGQVVYRRCDPATLRFEDRPLRLGVRWFVS